MPRTDVPDPAVARAANWQHPQANRQLLLDGQRLGYALAHSRRRSVGLLVRPEGLTVRAPTGLSQEAIDDVLRRKADWIARKLHDARQRTPPAGPAFWADGGCLDYLGQPQRLVVQAVLHRRSARVLWQPDRAELHVLLPAQAAAGTLQTVLPRWLQAQARQYLARRLDHYAPLLGVRYSALALSSARTRWGSASSSGTIRLNWRLIHLAPELIDYVVVHELSHLREMNHSPDFWGVVASVMPDYEQRRQALRQVRLAP